MFRRNFLYFVLWPLSLVLSLSTNEKSQSLLSFYPHQVLIHTGEIPQSLLQTEEFQFSLTFLIGDMSCNHLYSTLVFFWTGSSMFMSLMKCQAQTRKQLSRCVRAEQRGRVT